MFLLLLIFFEEAIIFSTHLVGHQLLFYNQKLWPRFLFNFHYDYYWMKLKFPSQLQAKYSLPRHFEKTRYHQRLVFTDVRISTKYFSSKVLRLYFQFFRMKLKINIFGPIKYDSFKKGWDTRQVRMTLFSIEKHIFQATSIAVNNF